MHIERGRHDFRSAAVRTHGAGDQEAFEMLVTRYHGPLLSYTTQRLADRQKAQDIVQKRLSGSFGI